MAKRQFTISLEPADEVYTSLVAMAPRWCSTALLVVREHLGLSKSGAALMEQLEPFLVDRSNSQTWPGTTLFAGSAIVSKYRLEPPVVEHLATATNGLFGWQQPELPEDLCLLRPGGDPWLVTLAHEGDAFIVLQQTEFEELCRDLPAFTAFLCEEPEDNSSSSHN